jgi:hypothetical protein
MNLLRENAESACIVVYFDGVASLGYRRCKERCVVPLLSPVSRQIVAQDAPLLRRVAILRASTITRGRPRRLPFALGLRRLAFTLHNQRTLELSYGPEDDKDHPAGVDVSNDSFSETQWMPRA